MLSTRMLLAVTWPWVLIPQPHSFLSWCPILLSMISFPSLFASLSTTIHLLASVQQILMPRLVPLASSPQHCVSPPCSTERNTYNCTSLIHCKVIVFNHKYVILKYFEIFYCKDARNLKFFQTDLKAWWDEVTRKEGTQNIWTWANSEWGRHINCVTFPCCGMLRLLWELSHSSYSRVVLYKLYNCLKILPSLLSPIFLFICLDLGKWWKAEEH